MALPSNATSRGKSVLLLSTLLELEFELEEFELIVLLPLLLPLLPLLLPLLPLLPLLLPLPRFRRKSGDNFNFGRRLKFSRKTSKYRRVGRQRRRSVRSSRILHAWATGKHCSVTKFTKVTR